MPEYENFHSSNFSCNYFGIICNAKDYRDCICTDRYAFEIAIVENVQKKTLNLIDEANTFKKYVFDNRWGSVSELATKLGKSVAYITKRLMLLDLPSEVTKAINKIYLDLVLLRNFSLLDKKMRSRS